MKKTTIKLLVVDLDGTLTDGTNQVSGRNFAAIQQLLGNQIKVVIATGRSHEQSLPIYQQLQMGKHHLPMICLNGAIIYDPINETPFDVVFLQSAVIREIASLASVVGKIFIDEHMRTFTTDKNIFVQNFEKKYDMQIDFISLAQLLNKNIVSGFVISDSLTKVNQVVGTVTNPQVRFASSMKNSTQFSNTSKYEAIQKLAQK